MKKSAALAMVVFLGILFCHRAVAQTKNADFDGNGKVDFEDFFLFAAAFGSRAPADLARFDLDNSGAVDLEDFFRFAAAFASPAGGPTTQQKRYSISGWLKEQGAGAMSGATVELKGAKTAEGTTDANGEFVFRDLPDGTYTVTPTQPGWVFSPRSFAVTLAGIDYAVGEIKCVKQFLTVTLVKGVTMEMVYIPPGKFLMGSPVTEVGRSEDEGPQHEVTISRGFYLGRYEVTQAQWESVMNTRPWGTSVGTRLPVVASWATAQTFVKVVNDAEGMNAYRLPTEAEWEYACRAGTTTPWSFGDDSTKVGSYAWYTENSLENVIVYVSGVPWPYSEKIPHEIGRKSPNAWGLSDMHGNLGEWVQDWYGPYSVEPQVDPVGPISGEYRIPRGGTVLAKVTEVRSALRLKATLGGYYGFRLYREY